MTTEPEPSPRQPGQRDFSTDEGRLRLYYDWVRLRMGEGMIVPEKKYTREERSAFFANWFRWVVAEHYYDPQKRLPPYTKLVTLPFNLREKDVTRAIRQLRTEQVLPPRKTRKDKDQPQWTHRDEYAWWYIGHMRALRFDQLRRLLARESDYEIEGNMLSISRTTEIKDRWVEEKIAVYRPVFHHESGWVHLTRRGLREAELDFRAETQSVRSLNHLYWITEVRMQLEEELENMEWISERSIQAEQEQRQKGQKRKHIPDGILVLPGKDGKKAYIDIEVQISKPSVGEVEDVMGDYYSSGSIDPLRYYANRLSRGAVNRTYRRMQKERRAMRPWIEIIDLAKWHRPTGIPPINT